MSGTQYMGNHELYVINSDPTLDFFHELHGTLHANYTIFILSLKIEHQQYLCSIVEQS